MNKILIGICFILFVCFSGCDVIDEISDSKGTPEAIISQTLPEGTLAVHFIDVGQGDATFIDLGETEILIDTGKRGSGVANYIENYVDGPLEAFVPTHPDADHIGEADVIFDRFDILETYGSGDTKTTQTYIRYEEALEDEGTKYYTPKRGETITIENLEFIVINPEDGSNDDFNNNSIALYLKYGDVDFIFMADCEEEVEDEILDEYTFALFEIDFLKVGHHGSKTSSSTKFMQNVTPIYVIYSAGEGNSYGHPHPEAVAEWKAVGAKIYGTDIHGTVIVTTDGTTETTNIITDVL